MVEIIKLAAIIRRIITAGNSLKYLILLLVLFGFCFSQQYDSERFLKDFSKNRLQETIERHKILINKYSQNIDKSKFFFDMGEIVVNLLDESGNKVLYIRISLGVEKQEDLNILTQIRPVIADGIIKTASSKTFDEISTVKGKEIFSYEIADAVNKNTNRTSTKKETDIIKYIFFDKFFIEFQNMELEERVEAIESILKLK